MKTETQILKSEVVALEKLVDKRESENANLRAVNTDLLAAAKRALVHGANEYAAEDQLREAIAKAESLAP